MLPLLHFANVSSARGWRWSWNDFTARAHAWAMSRLDKTPLVDILMCGVAAEACLALEPFAAHVVARLAHRFDQSSCGGGESWLQISDSSRWQTGFQTGRMLQRLAKSRHHMVTAGHLLDVAYTRHFTGIEPWLWQFTGAGVSGAYNPLPENRNRLLLLPSWPFDPNFDWRVILREQLIMLGQAGFQLDTPRNYYGDFTHGKLMTHRLAVTMPYSVGSHLWHEMYRLGMPMFAPSVSLLTELHLRYGMVWHRCCELRPHCQQACYLPPDFGQENTTVWDAPSSALTEDRRRVILPPYGSMQEQDLHIWLSFLEEYHFPHIEYFKSFTELLRRLGQVTDDELRERSALQSCAMQEMEVRSASAARARLEALVAAGPSPPFNPAVLTVPPHLPRPDCKLVGQLQMAKTINF